MLNYINNHWSIARRLTVIAVMGLLPSVPVLWGVTAADLANIDTARQEIDGLDLQDKVWAFMEKAETGGKADAARELQAKVAAYPHRDAIAPDVDALFAARGDVARTKVGADLFDEIASVSKLALDPEAGSYYLMDILSQRLPHLRHQLAEIDDHLRQAPADGRLEPHVATHLAIAAEMTTRIRTSSNRLKAEDAAAWSRLDPQLQVLAEYERWYESRSESLAALGTNDIRAAVRSIGAAKSALWQTGKSELERMLVERVDHNWADIVKHSATVGVLALVALALALLLARAFALVLARQIDSLDRLSRDDDAVDVGSAPSTNENGAIAASLVRLKDSLRERRRLAEETKRQVVEKEQLNAHYVREHEVFMEAFREAANRLAAGDFAHRITKTVIDEYREIVEVMNGMSERLEKTQDEIETGNVRRDEAIAAVAAALSRLAEGDLRARIEDGVASEFEKLKADFNSAVQELELSIGEVKSNTGSIKLGTDEISAASDDLSRRTENQAATLEQTAAAVAEITTAVAKTSESATQANNIVAGTRADAERSGEVVSNAISAMSAIEKSSQQISQIIGVIDEIAFQTNLLALNAGVEAARAGEAGRGFAVVASEVRALAQRSAEAAKQIKGLISTSSKEVATGVELVGETGRALKRILEQVSEVSTAVAGIAASARSQAEGLSQVNTAVAQMDDVTQQNAAMVEQATAATRALLQQTEQLSSVVDRFKTGNRGMSDALHMMKGRMAAAPAPRESHAKGRPSKVAAVAVANARASAAGGWEEF